MIGVSPVAIARYGFAPALQQPLDDRRARIGARLGHGRGLEIVDPISLGASREQEVHGGPIVPVRRPVQRGRPGRVGDVDVHLGVEQRRHRLHVLRLRGAHETKVGVDWVRLDDHQQREGGAITF